MTKKKLVLNSITPQQKLGCGNLQITIAYNGEELSPKSIERISATAGRNGSCVRATTQNFGDMLSIFLPLLKQKEKEFALREVVKLFKDTGCVNVQENVGKLSCADGFAKLIEKYVFSEDKGEV